jgi:hypothetical protein
LVEISRTPDARLRQRLFAAIHAQPITILPSEPVDEIKTLADCYLAQGIIPTAKREDALHVAHATVHEVDILLSWNFKHLANVRREAMIVAFNRQAGYWHSLRLLSPLEVADEDQS